MSAVCCFTTKTNTSNIIKQGKKNTFYTTKEKAIGRLIVESDLKLCQNRGVAMQRYLFTILSHLIQDT